MGILKRFTDIMSANINALLDKAEDPSKMIDQYLRNLTKDLAEVKEETASIMAEEARAKREMERCMAEIRQMSDYAEKAVMAGNDGDASKFLTEKARLNQKLTDLQQTYQLANANAAKMRQMHDKLCNDINELQAKRESIKAKISVAKTQERVNKMTSAIGKSTDAMSDFARMEARANKMLDEANAMAELNMSGATSEIDGLMDKYDSSPSMAVEDELAALKARLGK